VTGEDLHRELERIEELGLDERADAYRAAQRRLQERLERPARPVGG
jgi:aspartate aminotransferase-like enzyme